MQQPANFSKKNFDKPTIQYPAPNRLEHLEIDRNMTNKQMLTNKFTMMPL